MADDFKVQANIKFGNDLFNFRGQDVEEVTVQLEGFAENAERIFEAYDKVRQVTLAKGIATSQGFVPAPQSGNAGSHSAPAAGVTASELRCKHGPYKDLNGKRKRNGEPYQYRYYCPGPFGSADNCKAQSLPGQENWSG